MESSKMMHFRWIVVTSDLQRPPIGSFIRLAGKINREDIDDPFETTCQPENIQDSVGMVMV